MGCSDKESYTRERGESFIGGPANSSEIETKSEAGVFDKKKKEKTDSVTKEMDGCLCEHLWEESHSIIKVAQEVIEKEYLNVEKIILPFLKSYKFRWCL